VQANDSKSLLATIVLFSLLIRSLGVIGLWKLHTYQKATLNLIAALELLCLQHIF
jgi:hypothetical protein